MVGPSNLKTLHPLQVFSLSKLIPSCTLSSMEIIKNLLQTLIFSHLKPLLHALSKAKSKLVSILVQILKTTNQPMKLIFYPNSSKKIKIKNKNKKIFFGSFRLHYNWCSSSHVLPVPQPIFDGLVSNNHIFYDSSLNSMISSSHEQCVSEDCAHDEEQLSSYLQWLEDQKVCDKYSSTSTSEPDVNELAELFIANCHEKFMLEKQESYRMFQEMLARSIEESNKVKSMRNLIGELGFPFD